MKTFVFTFNDKMVTITNLDSSSNKVVNSTSTGYEQTLFDNIDDSKVFTAEEITKISRLSSVEFLSLLSEQCKV
ncbi:hypothetical protein MA9V1_004 [Chryseobacterium phage MA9V-1]|nr:hypothetical protein MA9V1_004 [Chryseobacterium phage MA9V-1]